MAGGTDHRFWWCFAMLFSAFRQPALAHTTATNGPRTNRMLSVAHERVASVATVLLALAVVAASAVGWHGAAEQTDATVRVDAERSVRTIVVGVAWLDACALRVVAAERAAVLAVSIARARATHDVPFRTHAVAATRTHTEECD